MTRTSVFRSATALLAAASLGLSMTAQAEGKYIMGTATTGGTYYPVRCGYLHTDQGKA